MIRMIRNNSNFLPVIAGIALMTISACASATSAFNKATQDAAVAEARAEAATAQRIAVDAARAAAVGCTDPVCDNVVNADDLPSFPTAVTSNDSTFLTITGTEINTTGITRLSGGQQVAPILRGATRAGDNMDGFRYFAGQFGGTGDTVYFAGILPTTNLGAPLTAQPTTAVWPGSYSERGRTAPLDFNIDFANRRITALANPGGVVVVAVSFNLGFSDSGLINGIIVSHAGATGDEPLDGLAIATGLIGTEGLVGAFVESPVSPISLGFHGGFVANNPDTN